MKLSRSNFKTATSFGTATNVQEPNDQASELLWLNDGQRHFHHQLTVPAGLRQHEHGVVRETHIFNLAGTMNQW